MQENDFKIGDLVRLKSGGPVMTVTDDAFGVKHLEMRCKWFNCKKLESGAFNPTALVPADAEGASTETQSNTPL